MAAVTLVRDRADRAAPPLVRDRAEKPVPPRTTIRLWDPGYPEWLARVDPPPAVLRAVGDASLLDGPAVAIVGSRAATRFGRQMAGMLGAGVAAEGVVVVSGLARGIDAGAHDGALSVGGPTVAVLGGGLDVAVPAATRRLGGRIAREGCVVTEYEDGVPPLRHHFPERNRIVAGLARLVVVVEAGRRSGALITARLALDSGREVMAVPAQPLASNSVGVNRLLYDGARPARSPADVMEALLALPGVPEGLAARKAAVEAAREAAVEAAREAGEPEAAPVPEVPVALRAVLDAFGEKEALPAGTIAERAGLALGPALAALTRLELAGLVRMVSGRRYERVRS